MVPVPSAAPNASSSPTVGANPGQSNGNTGQRQVKQPNQPIDGNNSVTAEAAPKPPPVTIKYKAAGKELTVTEEEARKKLELVDGAYGKFEEAAKLRKNAQTILSAAKEDPFALIERLHGPEVARQLLEEHVAKIVARENLPPEERSKADLKEQRRKFEEDRQKYEDERRQEQVSKKAENYKRELLPVMRNTLKAANIPDNPHAIGRLAGMFEALLDAGMPLDRMTMERAADRLRHEYTSEISAVFKDLSADQLAAWLGESNLQKLRQRDIATAQSSISNGRQAQPTTHRVSAQPKGPQIMSIEDYRDRLRSG